MMRKTSPKLGEKEECIIEKLTRNTVLTGEERKKLIEMLQEKSYSVSNCSVNTEVRAKLKNKKNQVDLPCKKCGHTLEACLASEKDGSHEISDIAKQPGMSITDEMKLEARKTTVNKENIRKLMDNSFKNRRDLILRTYPKVIQVKEVYPLLFGLEEVQNELDRIFYKGKCEQFLSNIAKYSSAILDLIPDGEPLKGISKQFVISSETLEEKKFVNSATSVLLLSRLLKEPRSFFLLENEGFDPSNVYPHVEVGTSSYSNVLTKSCSLRVMVENLQLCLADNVLDAYLCFVASFFIFDICYPQQSFNTMVVMEKLYLESDNTEEPPDNAAEIIKLLQRKVL